MVVVWLLFTIMLFVLEPLVLTRWLAARARTQPESTYLLVHRLHWALLGLSIVTIVAAVLGSHGLLLFE